MDKAQLQRACPTLSKPVTQSSLCSQQSTGHECKTHWVASKLLLALMSLAYPASKQREKSKNRTSISALLQAPLSCNTPSGRDFPSLAWFVYWVAPRRSFPGVPQVHHPQCEESAPPAGVWTQLLPSLLDFSLLLRWEMRTVKLSSCHPWFHRPVTSFFSQPAPSHSSRGGHYRSLMTRAAFLRTSSCTIFFWDERKGRWNTV